MRKKILLPILSISLTAVSTIAISCVKQEEKSYDIKLSNFKFKTLEGDIVDPSKIDIKKVIKENIEFEKNGEDANKFEFSITKVKPNFNKKELELIIEVKDKETKETIGLIHKNVLGFKGTKTNIEFDNFKFKNKYGMMLEAADVYAKDISALDVVYEASGENLKYYNHNVSNVKVENGNLKIYIDIFPKDSNNSIETIIKTLTGFKKDESSIIVPEVNNETSDIDTYLNASQSERFEIDNKDYYQQILKRINSQIESYRPEVKRNSELIEKFDEQAKKLDIDSYNHLLAKNFTLPVLEDGVKKLQIFEGERLQGPSKTDAFGVHNKYLIGGLARNLINEKYKDIALQTFAINFTNKVPRTLNERIMDIEYAFNETFKRIKYKNEESNESDKKDVVVWMNNTFARMNIFLDLTKKYQPSQLTKAKEIVKEYQDKLKQLDQYNFFASHTFNGEKFDENSNLSLYKKEDYISYEPDNYVLKNTAGTMWILDAKVEENGKYPTKFFFGTNVHVADAFGENTISIAISRPNESIVIKQEIKPNENDPRFDTFTFPIRKQGTLKQKASESLLSAGELFKNIFMAKDFLKAKPADYLVKSQAKKYQDTEDFADFAIMEMDFSKIKDFEQIGMYANNDIESVISIKNREKYNQAESFAKLFTNEYASEKNKDKRIKLLKESYLKNYEKIDSPLAGNIASNIDSLYLLGYPSTQFDYYLSMGDKKYTNYKYITNSQYKQSLWINASSNFDNSQNINHERGNRLSYQIGLRNFKSKPGIVDAFLSVPNKNADAFYQAPDGKKFINMGLEYAPRFYSPGGGASGSSMRNQDNEIIGAYHLKYGNFGEIGTGLTIALRSEGFNYQGLFGDYNLPQYDLIYGKGKEQKNSYREQLGKIYPDIKTFLLPHGTKEEGIPDEFKFKN
ncbi:Ig-specific serine endopeptidase MIP [Mycoplasma phocimorsus]|uniref:Ig-specific serine endopeptidase MIP n=1 Tax=Mycoplasma phocimorsus TaxID=3045839 RepID=UPI0024C0AD95|nr:DUF31 family protein [Mycoplasma phocimorsus]MDJ1648110.1 DUF31 family protein [Mycoplasma phocimorsus]